jgi:hypothetical protein
MDIFSSKFNIIKMLIEQYIFSEWLYAFHEAAEADKLDYKINWPKTTERWDKAEADYQIVKKQLLFHFELLEEIERKVKCY